MPGKIFINYRRDDSLATAGRLHDRLARSFGNSKLFMDVDKIPAGVDFVRHLEAQVAACDVFLAIVGPHWLDARDERGQRRIANPEDFVAIEIGAALKRDIRVIPVLVDGARMPREHELPAALRALVRRNAVEVRNTQFGRDAEVLTTRVREALRDTRSGVGRIAMVAAVVVAMLGGGWIALQQIGASPQALLEAVREGDAARLTHGALRIRVPSGLVGSNYWVYVDGKLYSAPPRAEATSLLSGSRSLVAVGIERGIAFLDDKGATVVRLDDDRLTYAPDMVGRVFQHVEDVRLTRGRHSIELWVPGESSMKAFPFAIARRESDASVGQSEALDFGPPRGYRWGATGSVEMERALRPMLPILIAPGFGTPDSFMEEFRKRLQQATAGLDADPIARVLSDLAVSLRLSPPARPVVLVELPKAVGGPRELDASQVSAIVDRLHALYSVALDPSEVEVGRKLPAPHSSYFATLESQSRAHDKRIEDLRQIVSALRRAR